MRIVHSTINNGSGLNRVSVNMATTERKLGLDSYISFTDKPEMSTPEEFILNTEESRVADVHVVHSHLPDRAKGKTVFIPHGTPEHCFQSAIEQNKNNGFAAGDAFMLSMHRINTCDVVVTFWDRHRYIWQSLNPKADVRCIPMGVDTDFWKPTTSKGKWAGNPSLLSCENSHSIKWPLDLIIAFPEIMRETEAVMHLHYMPIDQHRFWYPLMNANGTMYKSYSSGMYMDADSLRNAFNSVDYYISPVRYGDFNSVCLEAKASGCKVISYKGNPYADYHIQEGDQRVIVKDLLEIFKGNVEPNKTQAVDSVETMSKQMISIYEEICK